MISYSVFSTPAFILSSTSIGLISTKATTSASNIDSPWICFSIRSSGIPSNPSRFQATIFAVDLWNEFISTIPFLGEYVQSRVQMPREKPRPMQARYPQPLEPYQVNEPQSSGQLQPLLDSFGMQKADFNSQEKMNNS